MGLLFINVVIFFSSIEHDTNFIFSESEQGYVVKFNANQRYATTAITTAILREVAKAAGVPLQDFVVKNDSPCGSTIGPIMSAKLGMPTIDIGAPQLSMHSIREMCCTSSIYQGVQLFQGFFENYPRVFASMNM
ncbi:aspartyl aminopeptidase-like [Pecten maximus]|uniref:aspartyl aminopeptidase-like n=1 Tax=Pecten maximus TaxID=6579 RepID=UPI0014586DC8|nr:aspartyl aminopeptidase-like [Pecten maximus]